MSTESQGSIVFPSSLEIVGGQVPSGTVRVSGAKNAATRLLAAAMLTDEPVHLQNFPTQLVDAQHKMKFMRRLGAQVNIDHVAETVSVETPALSFEGIDSYDVPIRTTYLLTAGQILRNKVARIPYPGGCKIGARGYDLHVMVWEKLGCTVVEHPDYIEITGGFVGGLIDFPISTVGGTESALICAVGAEGDTEVRNAYITPEVENLIDLLNRMGASIEVSGNSTIHIRGAGGLLHGARITIMADRIEALTWITLAALTGGSLTIQDVPFDDMEIPLIHLVKAGIDFYRNSDSVYIDAGCLRSGFVQPFEVACGTHPGIISDMQPFYVLLGLKAKGTSQIFDYRYPQRIGYIEELAKFDATSVSAKHGQITTHGIANMVGTEVNSTDLRGSMAMIMAGIMASGTTLVHGTTMALRGYNNLLGKFAEVGISVTPIFEP